MKLFFSVLLTCLWVSAAAFQSEQDVVDVPFTPVVPSLDDFVDMQPSTRVAPYLAEVSSFIQREPSDGTPATQATHVYLAYDEKNFYAIFAAFDSEPDKIRARISPREEVFSDDSVNIMIDTFNDRRRAYMFLVTPRGIQWEGIWTEEQDFDSSFNAVWSSEGRLTDQGYLVRIAIPFRSLRFPPGEEQEWAVMFNRMIPRLNECSYWPLYTNRIQGRLNQAGLMRIGAEVQGGRNQQYIPYVSYRSFDVLDPNAEGGAAFVSDDFDADIGLDAKFVIRDQFVLDVAANPDFSQIESDQPQITVNERFEVFFPERRPFFLENADIFQTPLNMVFTRRIADPRAGIRLTGKQGPYAIGALIADDESAGKRLPVGDPRAGDLAGFGVLRVSRDIFSQSKVGVLYTGRVFEDDENHVGGIDGRMVWNKNWNSRYQFLSSSDRRNDVSRSGHAMSVDLNRSGRNLNNHIHYLETSPEFRTELGFLNARNRIDSRNLHGETSYRFWTEGERLISWVPAIEASRTEDQSGQRLSTEGEFEVAFDFRGQTELSVSREWSSEFLRIEDLPGLTTPLDFSFSEWQVGFESSYLQSLSVDGRIALGTAPNFVPAEGDLPYLTDAVNGSLGLTWRPLSQLRIDQTYLLRELSDRNDGELVFSSEVWRLRANWQFNRFWSLRAIVQYDVLDTNTTKTSLASSENVNGDILVTYLLNPWTALYVGTNLNYRDRQLLATEDGPIIVHRDGDLRRDADQVFVKFSYLFQ